MIHEDNIAPLWAVWCESKKPGTYESGWWCIKGDPQRGLRSEALQWHSVMMGSSNIYEYSVRKYTDLGQGDSGKDRPSEGRQRLDDQPQSAERPYDTLASRGTQEDALLCEAIRRNADCVRAGPYSPTYYRDDIHQAIIKERDQWKAKAESMVAVDRVTIRNPGPLVGDYLVIPIGQKVDPMQIGCSHSFKRTDDYDGWVCPFCQLRIGGEALRATGVPPKQTHHLADSLGQMEAKYKELERHNNAVVRYANRMLDYMGKTMASKFQKLNRPPTMHLFSGLDEGD